MGGVLSHVLRVRRWARRAWRREERDWVVEGSEGPSVWGVVEEGEGRRPRRVKARWEGWPVLGIMKVPLRSFWLEWRC